MIVLSYKKIDIEEEKKNIFHKRLNLLCDETREKTGHNPQRLRNILNGVAKKEWFSEIRRLVLENVADPYKIEGIEYLYDINTGESFFELTIEALIVENEDYRSLFSDKEIRACKDKLEKLEYKIKVLDC